MPPSTASQMAASDEAREADDEDPSGEREPIDDRIVDGPLRDDLEGVVKASSRADGNGRVGRLGGRLVHGHGHPARMAHAARRRDARSSVSRAIAHPIERLVDPAADRAHVGSDGKAGADEAQVAGREDLHVRTGQADVLQDAVELCRRLGVFGMFVSTWPRTPWSRPRSAMPGPKWSTARLTPSRTICCWRSERV